MKSRSNKPLEKPTDSSFSEDSRFEELVDRLESVVDDLENEELSLEDAIHRYQEGIQLSLAAHKKLKTAEAKIIELTKSGQLIPFETSSAQEEEED